MNGYVDRVAVILQDYVKERLFFENESDSTHPSGDPSPWSWVFDQLERVDRNIIMLFGSDEEVGEFLENIQGDDDNSMDSGIVHRILSLIKLL